MKTPVSLLTTRKVWKKASQLPTWFESNSGLFSPIKSCKCSWHGYIIITMNSLADALNEDTPHPRAPASVLCACPWARSGAPPREILSIQAPWFLWLAFLSLNAWRSSRHSWVLYFLLWNYSETLEQTQQDAKPLSYSDGQSHTLNTQSTVLLMRTWSYFFLTHHLISVPSRGLFSFFWNRKEAIPNLP